MARASPAAGSPCGAQPSTGAGPRITSGAVTPTPSPRVGAPPAAGSKAMARLSQPLSVRFGPGFRFPARPARRNASGRDSWWRRRGRPARLLLIEAGENGHRRIEREKAVERKAGVLADRRQRQRAVQQRVIGIADRRDRRQAIERAAQNNHHDARIARAGGARGLGRVSRREGDRQAPQRRAARKDRRGNEKPHAYLLWNSGDMNSSASACGRNSACKRASRSRARRRGRRPYPARRAARHSRAHAAPSARRRRAAASFVRARPRPPTCRHSRSAPPAATAACPANSSAQNLAGIIRREGRRAHRGDHEFVRVAKSWSAARSKRGRP